MPSIILTISVSTQILGQLLAMHRCSGIVGLLFAQAGEQRYFPNTCCTRISLKPPFYWHRHGYRSDAEERAALSGDRWYSTNFVIHNRGVLVQGIYPRIGIESSPLGRLMAAIRDDKNRVRFSGYAPDLSRLPYNVYVPVCPGPPAPCKLSR